jgi:chemotaxis protein CheY-P-specific phosphatase CheC
MNATKSRENYILHVMNKGFERAAQSFSQFIEVPITMTNTQFVLVRHDDDFTFVSEEKGNVYVLITQIIGEFAGKSYLIFNQEECEGVFQAVSKTKPGLSDSLKEPLLLEIDNIISASVIGALADSLTAEVYGDVPSLQILPASALQDIMSKDVDHEHPSSVIFTRTTFCFDDHQHITPQFIWKISTRVFDMIPVDKLSV